MEININELAQYREEIEQIQINFINYDINRKGLEETIKSLLHDADCTYVYGNYRMCQTIDYNYKASITKLLYIIDNYCDDAQKEYYTNKLLEQHRNNLLYEETNPPIVYENKKVTRKKSKKKVVQKDLFEESNKKAIKDRVAQLENLNIKIKIK